MMKSSFAAALVASCASAAELFDLKQYQQAINDASELFTLKHRIPTEYQSAEATAIADV
jgi:hypothetical protein